MPALRRVAVRTPRVLLVAVEKRPHGCSCSEFFDSWTVTFDFGISGARREADLFREDVEDTGQANESGVFGDCAGREAAKIQFFHKPQKGTKL